MIFRDSEFHLIHFDSPDAKATPGFRRANLIAISILAFFLLGVFLAALLPVHGNARVKSTPAPAKLVPAVRK